MLIDIIASATKAPKCKFHQKYNTNTPNPPQEHEVMPLSTYYNNAFITCILFLLDSSSSFSYFSPLPNLKLKNLVALQTNKIIRPTTTKTSSNHGPMLFVSPPSSAPMMKEDIIRPDKEISEGENRNLDNLSLNEVKSLLLTILQKSSIMKKDLVYISDLVNVLEQKYVPVQTLEFLNFAIAGEWEMVCFVLLCLPYFYYVC